jgi:hypothetical protein
MYLPSYLAHSSRRSATINDNENTLSIDDGWGKASGGAAAFLMGMGIMAQLAFADTVSSNLGGEVKIKSLTKFTSYVHFLYVQTYLFACLIGYQYHLPCLNLKYNHRQLCCQPVLLSLVAGIPSRLLTSRYQATMQRPRVAMRLGVAMFKIDSSHSRPEGLTMCRQGRRKKPRPFFKRQGEPSTIL